MEVTGLSLLRCYTLPPPFCSLPFNVPCIWFGMDVLCACSMDEYHPPCWLVSFCFDVNCCICIVFCETDVVSLIHTVLLSSLVSPLISVLHYSLSMFCVSFVSYHVPFPVASFSSNNHLYQSFPLVSSLSYLQLSLCF